MFPTLLVALLQPFLAVGCAIVGPASIRGGRLAYNDAIIATNDQQVLAMLVRMRYGEATGLLAVSSITANMQIRANAGAEFGVGPRSNFDGNLVPLSVGFAYEDNPTISYSPVQGEQYMRQLLSSIPIDLTVLLLNALQGSPEAMTLLLRSINEIHNPAFLADQSVEVDPRFTRLVELLVDLGRKQLILWTSNADGFALLVMNEDGDVTASVGELYKLLGFSTPSTTTGIITLPVLFGVGQPDEPAMHIVTRSLWQLFNIASARVEVPEAHIESGIAQRLPPVGQAGQHFRIQRSKDRPDQAITAIKRHGWWYYIDETDARSKLIFRMLESLMSVRIADTVDHRRATPVLTVPVSR